MTEKHICIFCNYSTTIKCNYKKHLNTKKHKKNYNNDPKISLMSTQSHTNQHQNNTNQHQNNTNQHQNNTNQFNRLKCSYCEEIFSRIDSKNRHINKNRCEIKKELDIKNITNNIVNNTNNINNITNNTNINNTIILNYDSIES